MSFNGIALGTVAAVVISLVMRAGQRTGVQLSAGAAPDPHCHTHHRRGGQCGMDDEVAVADVRTTTLADVLAREHVMDIGIRPVWPAMPRVAGPAFTVRCRVGDNLMLHAAIHRADPGSVVVVESGDLDFALAGGNVCAVALRRGIAAFVLDGLIRDIGEIRRMGFPVFARGVIPIPGSKRAVELLNVPARCGGVTVRPGDFVVADEDGVVVVPADRCDQVLAQARARLSADADETLDTWEHAHRSRIDMILRSTANNT